MGLIPEEVKCAVCKNIFCCIECRNRHERNAHNPNDVSAERNRLLCAFCQGYGTMEFQSRNDFALIMHLCQTHLPLHCKKCLTQFNSIGDFSAANKCSHINDVCSLQSPKECNSSKVNDSSSNIKDVSNINYVTAIQKSSFERSISDSVISLRNYSTILHSSNHPLYKTQSPDAFEKALVRQTSTPMHHNLMVVQSSDENGQSCNSCLISSTSSQRSHINSSSDSDTSSNPGVLSNEIRQNVQQQSIMVAQKKTATFKRPRNSLTMTPLSRQVMTKTIHRAILEYQHTHSSVGGASPKSPLDLRVRKMDSSTEMNPSKIAKADKSVDKADKSLKNGDENRLMSASAVNKSNSFDTNGRISPLETVYEQEKDAIDDIEHDNYISNSYAIIEVLNESKAVIDAPISSEPISETPVLVSRKLSAERLSNDERFDGDIWYTPKEFVQSKVIENIEIYTPKVAKKRPTARRVDDEEPIEELTNKFESRDISESETNKTPANKLWSFVSTIMRFASLSTASDLSMPVINQNKDESHVIIRRCGSFSGVLREKNTSPTSTSTSTSDEEVEIDPLQPIKRRRITSIDTSINRTAIGYRKRIMCRPPIRRMQNN